MKVFRKLLKWFGYLSLFIIVVLIGIYLYLAMKTGTTAQSRSIFQMQKSNFLVFAHRGGGGLFPENTLLAFEDSAKLGVDFLELDVHATADGTLVVMHDAQVERTTDGRGQIKDLSLADLKKLDAGYLFTKDNGATFPFRGQGITVPTLAEIFDALPAIKFNIEPKQQTPSIIKPLCSLIRERKMEDKIIVGSFHQAVIDEFRAECPEITTAASPSEVTKFLALSKTGLSESYDPPMQTLQIPENLGQLSVVTKEFVENAHRKNLKVHVWTINDPADMERLIKIGVDVIMTDYPDKLLKIVLNDNIIQN